MTEVSIGFTGSRHGATDDQLAIVAELLAMLRPSCLAVQHGDCVGFDQQVHELAITLGVHRIIVHPPISSEWRANCQPRPGRSDILLPAAPYQERDIRIVYSSALLIAAPLKPERDDLRSGTWFTIRRARARGCPVIELPRQPKELA